MSISDNLYAGPVRVPRGASEPRPTISHNWQSWGERRRRGAGCLALAVANSKKK
ncbi:MAG: hypothetical protein HIU84_13535 [Acidobacteria bacterium]|nr:hypothetical protein [Acidobacteriota bacterium]